MSLAMTVRPNGVGQNGPPAAVLRHKDHVATGQTPSKNRHANRYSREFLFRS